MELAQLACPLCNGAFQVDVAWQGTQVTCPHCQQVVMVPDFQEDAQLEQPGIVVEPDGRGGKSGRPEPKNTPQSPPRTISKVDALKLARRLPAETPHSPFSVRDVTRRVTTKSGETMELRHRTPEERLRSRRRLQLAAALSGAAFLLILLMVLLRLR